MANNKVKKGVDPELDEMVEESDKLHAIKVVLDQEGGKMLVDSLLTDTISSIELLTREYRTLSHADLIVNIARIEVYLSFVRTLYTARDNENQLNEYIKERLKGTTS